MINVSCQFSLVFHPEKANNVAVSVDYVVVHETTTVTVNCSTSILILHDDCVTACRNYHLFSKCTCNTDCFAVNFHCSYTACCTSWVFGIYKSAVSTVTTFDNNAVSVDYCRTTVTASHVQCDFFIGCIVEYTALSHIVVGVFVEFYVQRVLEVQEVTLRPLLFTKEIGSYFK